MANAHALQDTIVIDDPDAAPRPARSRTSTDGALTMQVLHGGAWHRRTPDLQHTACGQAYHSQFAPVRREELCHPLCPECFTRFEIRVADELAARDEDPR